MSEKMEIHVVCDPQGVPMRAFESEDAAKAFRFILKGSQPAAGFQVQKTDLYGPFAALVPADRRNPNLFKIHVVIDKKRNPHSAFSRYDDGKRTATATKDCDRAPLILDRSKFDE